MKNNTFGRSPFTAACCIALGVTLFLNCKLRAADLPVLSDAAKQRIAQALPTTAQAKPTKPRRLLIFTRNQEYQGHAPAIAASCEAFTLMGKKTGAFETTITDDPAIFERNSLKQFDAVFLNNTLGATFTDAHYRKNLLEFVTAGGGLMGVHSTVIAFTKSLWPAQEDWPEFGYLLGARGYGHRHGYVNEHITIKVDDTAHPLAAAFGGNGFEMTSEFFRHHEPWSRNRCRVILSIDTAKTDLSTYLPDDPDKCLRADHDYALAWIKHYGKGRVFFTGIGHNPEIYEDAKMLQLHLDAAQFVLGDLAAPTTPSAKLTPAVLAQEKLGWRIGIEAYTFHKYTFFETIDKTAELGLPYIGGLCSEQPVSKDIPKDFDQNLSDEEMSQIRMKLDTAGLRLLTYYVRKFPSDEANCRKLFEFANKMGIETFMGEPQPEHLEQLDKLANEYGVNIAIHNHDKGISPIYWSPENVLKACEGRSKRIGACPDIGYWLRSGVDPIAAIRLLKDRIITFHMHDLHEVGINGHDVPWGNGAAKCAEIFRELQQLNVKPTMIGIEYAYDWHESMPKIVKCIEFFNETSLKLTAKP
ncbi:MAG TPA: hypothetical protein DDW21_00815 [Verrucomicrobiales bacterium]|nr:MAG: hypothetical protein B9S37_02455 [Verrucomicrobiae bacterium Tous-C3TDCM]PAZ05446.1 MAG: hypothetical protein CAK88_08000 [Verrucomicrobiae bacterium AMD-G2]HBE22008.1 hypothetical protein [Verrucomicrobiales bacterium]